MNQRERCGGFAKCISGTCAGEDHGILGIVPGHARIVPNPWTQEVVALVPKVRKQLCPISWPLFVQVATATLPGNRGGKQNYVGRLAEALHKISRRRCRQMFGHFERERQVEAMVKL